MAQFAEADDLVGGKSKYLSPQVRAFVERIKPDLFVRRDYYDSGHSER